MILVKQTNFFYVENNLNIIKIFTMFSTIRNLSKMAPAGARFLSAEAARPMTRFVQYPFDKTKMVSIDIHIYLAI